MIRGYINGLHVITQAHTLAPSVYRRTVRQDGGVGHVALDGKMVRQRASIYRPQRLTNARRSLVVPVSRLQSPIPGVSNINLSRRSKMSTQCKMRTYLSVVFPALEEPCNRSLYKLYKTPFGLRRLCRRHSRFMWRIRRSMKLEQYQCMSKGTLSKTYIFVRVHYRN